MEVLSQPKVETVGHVIIAVGEQSIRHHRMALLEGTVHQAIIALKEHQILSPVRYVIIRVLTICEPASHARQTCKALRLA